MGAVPPYSYCGNDTAHLEWAGMECCLYSPWGYKDEVEKHFRIDDRVTCEKSLALTGVEVCKSKGR